MEPEEFHLSTRGLSPGEALAKCYAEDAQDCHTLALYQENLTRRTDDAALIASALICFDLATHHADPEAQAHFPYVVEKLRARLNVAAYREELIGSDAALSALWEKFQRSILGADPRFEPGREEISIDDLLVEEEEVELVPETVLQEPPEPPVEEKNELELRRYGLALQDFFGDNFMYPLPSPSGGFRLETRRDVQRLEAFVGEMGALATHVPGARIYRAWTLLFYGTHMRSRGLFGMVNTRKQEILREGLKEFGRLAPGIWEVAEMFSTAYCDPSGWEKMMELLTDYTVWLAHHPTTKGDGLEVYDPVQRLNELYRRRNQSERRRGPR